MGTGAEEDLEWNLHCSCVYPGFPGGSDDEGSVCNAGELGSILGLGGGSSPGERSDPHSGILAWRISGTEEPGELQSMGP